MLVISYIIYNPHYYAVSHSSMLYIICNLCAGICGCIYIAINTETIHGQASCESSVKYWYISARHVQYSLMIIAIWNLAAWELHRDVYWNVGHRRIAPFIQ